MPPVYRIVTRIQDQDDFSGSLTNGYYLKYDSGSGTFILDVLSGSSTNVLVNGGTVGTSGVGVVAVALGTVPTSAPADEVQLYAADYAAGDCRVQVLSETGTALWIGNGKIEAKAPASGAGTSITVCGSAAISGNTNGGDVVLTPGVKSGSGADGNVRVTTGRIITSSAGSAAYPSIAYAFNNYGTGIFFYNDSLNFSCNTTAVASIQNGLVFTNQYGILWSASTSLFYVNDTGLIRSSAAVVKVTDGSTGTGSLIATQLAAAAPASGAGNSLTLAGSAAVSGNTNGGNVVLTAGLKSGSGVDGQVLITRNGTVTAPALAWAGAPTTGWYSNGTTFVLAYSGVNRFSFDFANNLVALSADGKIAWSGTTGNSEASQDLRLVRASAAVLRVTNGSTGTGSLLSSALVEANTAGSGSPNVLTAAESGTLLTNEGATAQNYHTLPSAAAGLQFDFVVQDSDGMRITADTGDTIRDVATVSATAGYIQSTTVGSTLTLKAINATEWIVTAKQGTWTIDS